MVDIQRFKGSENKLIKGVFRVRKKVFIEEQKVKDYEEFDEYEENSIHFAALEGDYAIGTARYRETEKGIKLERFAVLKDRRGEGIGQQLLSAVLNEVLPQNRTVYLHAQVSAVDFYAKNNFEITGELFVECNIEHFPMEYKKEIKDE